MGPWAHRAASLPGRGAVAALLGIHFQASCVEFAPYGVGQLPLRRNPFSDIWLGIYRKAAGTKPTHREQLSIREHATDR